jgi:hypothetical protein
VLTKAEGEKFRFALKHDVVVVNDMWLIESAIAGGLWHDWASLLLVRCLDACDRPAVVGLSVLLWRGRECMAGGQLTAQQHHTY